MKLYWANETDGRPERHYILKRQTPTIRPFLPPHTHDYAELVYVERGSCVHQMNGIDTGIGKGDVLFIYPDVVEHCLHHYNPHFSILQILFPQESFWYIKNRYAESVESIFGQRSRNPLVNLGPMEQLWFERNFDRLLVDQGSLIEIERFLLNFIGLIQETDQPASAGSWLDRALREIQEPANFRRGPAGFVELCNRSAEHVEREVKKRTGRTVTDVVNQARMGWASYMLIFSDAEIVDIAYGCGLESMSYFYKLFRQHHGMSPGRYRRKAEREDITATATSIVPFRGHYFTSDGVLR